VATTIDAKSLSRCMLMNPPLGCRFASYVQLREAVELFLKAWGASGSHGSS
jgi:hypothetical protein